MKAAIIKEKDLLNIENIPNLPSPSEYQCLCKNLYASSCTGTDQKIIANKLPWESKYPAVLGHETVGEIIEIGNKVANYALGDIVLRAVYVYHGEQLNGFNAEFGGFSEYGYITDNIALENDKTNADYNPYSKYQMTIPKAWRDRPEAVLFITMKETFSWINIFGSLYGKRVAVIGAGTVGMFFMKFASIMCAKEVVGIARSNAGKKRSINCGADSFVELDNAEKLTGEFDLIIDAAGVMRNINAFTPFIKAGGTYAVYGVSNNMTANIDILGHPINFAFHGPDEGNQLIHDTCVSLVNKGIVDLQDFHSSIMPFDELPSGFKKIKSKEEFKPIFKF